MADCVWIVAVEKYKAEGPAASNLDIDAALGEFAFRVAKLARQRDPRARIVANLSLRSGKNNDEALQALTQCAFRVRGATQQDVQDSLDDIAGCDSLLLYWIGHGVNDPRDRFLLFADSRSANDLRVLAVDSLLKHLRDRRFPKRQIGFFDTCAQVIGTPSKLDLGGEGRNPADQHFYFAASAGHIAQAGAFSSAIIDALESAPAFPPDAKVLFANIHRRLDALEISSRPFQFHWTDGSGDMWSGNVTGDEGLAVHAEYAGLSAWGLRYLVERAKGFVSVEQIADAWRTDSLGQLTEQARVNSANQSQVGVFADAWRRLSIANSLEASCRRLTLFWHDWQRLLDRVNEEGNLDITVGCSGMTELLVAVLDQTYRERGFEVLTRLLIRAAQRAKTHDPVGAEALLDRLKGHDQLGPMYDKLATNTPEDESNVFLLIELSFGANAAGTLPWVAGVENSWVYRSTELEADGTWLHAVPPGFKSLAEQIQHLVQKALAKYLGLQLTIELLAPHDLLCPPRKLLEIFDDTLGDYTWLEQEHPIVVRWLNRMRGEERCACGSWIHRAHDVKWRARSQTLECAWNHTLGSELVLGIEFAGPSPDQPKRNRGTFFERVKLGNPYMCWPRETPSDTGAFKACVCDLVTAHTAHSLPHGLRDAKNKEKQQRPAEFHEDHLILMIDDPARNPKAIHLMDTPQRTTP